MFKVKELYKRFVHNLNFNMTWESNIAIGIYLLGLLFIGLVVVVFIYSIFNLLSK